MPATISRQSYAQMFGPTTGRTVCGLPTRNFSSRSRRIFTTYGEEVKFGGGKVIRDGMGQSQVTRADRRRRHGHHQCAGGRPYRDLQGGIGLKDGRIAGIGKAGNPDTQPGA